MKGLINIKFWGVRGSTPCANEENMHYGGNTTCFQVQIPGNPELLIIDSGTGFRNLGNKLESNGYPNKGRIFITHPHWDHLQGFPFFKPFYDSKNWYRIYMPPQGDISCKEILQGHMSSTFFPVSMDMLEADLHCETIQPDLREFQNYSIEYMWATHTVPTAMYKLRVADKTIIFAPDNELLNEDTDEVKQFKKEFRSFIHGADILIHDGQYTREQYEKRNGWGHSVWNDVLDLAKDEEVSRLFITHHDPDNNDAALKLIDEEIQEKYSSYFDTVTLAIEGQEINLPFNNTK